MPTRPTTQPTAITATRAAKPSTTPFTRRRGSSPRQLQDAVDAARDALVVVGQLGGQYLFGRPLPRHRPQEAADRRGAARGVLGVRRGPRAAGVLGPRDGDAGRVTVVDDPAGTRAQLLGHR